MESQGIKFKSYVRISHKHTRWRLIVVTGTAGLLKVRSLKNTDVRLPDHLKILYDIFSFDTLRSWITGYEIPKVNKMKLTLFV